MGTKRWLLAISILIVVVGLLTLIFVQTGVDERIVDSILPRVEKKLGLNISYQDVNVSLSSVVFEQVTFHSRVNNKPLAVIKRLGVGVRVGPLLIGDLDITGVRIDGLEIRMGQAAGGADIAQWRELFEQIKASSQIQGEKDLGSSGKKTIEINIVSGKVVVQSGPFAFTVDEFHGLVTGALGAELQLGNVDVRYNNVTVLSCEQGEISLQRPAKSISVVLDSPKGKIQAQSAYLQQVHSDFKDLAGQLGLFERSITGDGGVPPEQPDADATKPWSLEVVAQSGKAFVMHPDEPMKQLSLTTISGKLVAIEQGDLIVRVTGGLLGTDARWTAAITRPKNKPLVVSMEVPDLPLKRVVGLFLDADYLDLDKSFADGNVQIEFVDGAEAVSFAGQIAISNLGIFHERIGLTPLKNFNVHFDFKLSLDLKNNELHMERLLVSRGLARFTLRGTVNLDKLDFDVSINVPPTACRQIYGAIPKELIPKLDGVVFEGLLGLDMRLSVDKEAPEKTELVVNLENGCRIDQFGNLPKPSQFRGPFAYSAYSADGNRMRLTTGPGTSNWTNLVHISPFVVEAVLTTEDGKFRHHKGVTVPEMRRAIELNLKKGGMFHGASTLTMQLAKNLFLSRERTVSRKVQELFFAYYLEYFFTKDELLELYLNVIEYGPNLYGITEAAYYYFGRSPAELNLVESVFLVKLLPNPVKRHGPYQRNRISVRHSNMLKRVMKTMLSRKRITAAEYQAGLMQQLDFYQEGEPPPPSRIPPRSGVSFSDEEGLEDETGAFEPIVPPESQGQNLSESVQ